MKIKFCGAAQEVTGSAHLVTLDDGTTILLDCGLYQGSSSDMKDFNETWQFDPKTIDILVLSHAHIDHSGRIPKLVKDGFKGKIYATHATRSLCSIMLLDSAKIQESDASYYNRKMRKRKKKFDRREPLYSTKDAKRAVDRFVALPYDRWQRIHDQVEVQYRDAGHILGSASVTLRYKKKDGSIKMIGFTGDIGRPDRPILRDPQPMPACDYLISESTYGDRFHENKPQEVEHFLRIIHETCVVNKGKLLVPAFSIGRTQEIVHMLDQLETAGRLPRIRVFVDSPLAVNATVIFGAHPECYDSDLNEYMLIDDNPFGFNNLTYVKSVEQSKAINDSKEPCIIISSSGMMNAGRVKHHLFNVIENKRNTILIVGYCAPNTPGGKLRAGHTNLHLFGQNKQVLANIEMMDSFSAHGDQTEMLDFLRNHTEKAEHLFLVHGNLPSQQVFQGELQKIGFSSVEIPKLGQEYVLD